MEDTKFIKLDGQMSRMKGRFVIFMLLFICSLPLFSQKSFVVSGKILDVNDEPLIGATVQLKNQTSVGTVADFDGNFSLTVPSSDAILIVSYIGMTPQEVKVKGKKTIVVVLREDSEVLEEVVVVGYGQQKKASVVGAITQTKGEVLQRSGGINDIASALTGNLPGVTTMQSSGMPGDEEPEIVIRGASSWNNSSPLVLVDGVEREMSSVDMSSVQSISVLKDASATAVYGVKGANGVILITTKRGEEGKMKINVSGQATFKTPSKLPYKYDSYDALSARNIAVSRELPLNPAAWQYITPQSMLDKYRNPASLEEAERYPNVDWQKALFKDFAMSYNANLNISGGTKVVKYFVSADFVNEGDLFKSYDNGRGYDAGYGYNKLTVRSNLDFQLTKSTLLTVNLTGVNGIKKGPWGGASSSSYEGSKYWRSVYSTPPDAFMPQYSDGSWGYYPKSTIIENSAAVLAVSGLSKTTNTKINTDFTLVQNLDFITKNLKFRFMVSWDNSFTENNRGISDEYNHPVYKWIDPVTGNIQYEEELDPSNKFEYQQPILWDTNGGTMANGSTVRNLNYQAQLNWNRKFRKHDISAMGLFSRQEHARGTAIPSKREDWAARFTYDYNRKYFLEYNAALNGSDKFSDEYRFGFFNSGAVGWMISEEKFMSFSKKWLDMLKFRVSYGEVGDDNISERWLYLSQWSTGGQTPIGLNLSKSPYVWVKEKTVGNPDVHWETVRKLNVGIDYSFLNGLFAGNVEIFRDNRVDILVDGDTRSVPVYFGATPSVANLGKVTTEGYELELRFNKVVNKDFRVWGNFNMTHAESLILDKDDPELYPDYMKKEGFQMGQNTSYIDVGFINSFDELYGSPKHNQYNENRLPGDFYIADYNGDGIIDDFDKAPYGYSSTPQNTYSASAGFDWKGFSLFVQFYGVNNVTRNIGLKDFDRLANTVFDKGEWWSMNSTTAEMPIPRYSTTVSSYSTGSFDRFDASYIRLKNLELAYTFSSNYIRKLGLSNLRVFLNGNNLLIWTRMPDDREKNSGNAGQGAYPTMRRFNLGIKFTL